MIAEALFDLSCKDLLMLRISIVTLSILLVLLLLTTNAHAQSYNDWRHAGEMWLLTTPEGANLPAGAVLEDFPVLIRLLRDWFDFSQAEKQGEDIRFTASDGKPLAYQIETWDSAKGEAQLWVRIPKVSGNARQMIRVHWGNVAAKSESSGQAVFSAANGYLSIWHMTEPVRDETGLLTMNDTGTTATVGMIGTARHLPGGKGLFGGDKIEGLPVGSDSHSTEAWFRAEKPNVTIIGWGNEQAQGKVVMQYRSPPHVRMDCYFSGGNVESEAKSPLGEWTQAVHTYEKGEAKLYINGKLAGTNRSQGAPLNIRNPARLFLGGWYHNYDFVGDIDEVRVSKVTRTADWIKLQYENQKPNQMLVGPLVQPGSDFSVSAAKLEIAEGKSAAVTVKAGGAQKLIWILKRGEQETVVATDRFTYSLAAGRVVGDAKATLICKAVFPDKVQTKTIEVAIREAVAEPEFTLDLPLQITRQKSQSWDGKQPLEIIPEITNLEQLKSQSGAPLNYVWTTDNVAVGKQVVPGKLILTRALGNGRLRISVEIDNGGPPVTKTLEVVVNQHSSWGIVARPVAASEQPEDNQFIAREGGPLGKEGTIHYTGVLDEPAESVFLRVFADDKLIITEKASAAEKKYAIATKIKAGLIKYRTEFGVKNGERERILHTAANIVCGDVYLIIGQSNAVATDFGKENPLKSNEWVRTFGATDGGPQGARLKLWAPAEARSPGGKAEIGYWGMELGRRLVESAKLPICFINGAVGGTRIDQHQRNNDDPTDVKTIYGRMLWRAQQARLTHGVRGIIWHQGENDQGADGPTGGYGYETYQQYFVDLAASWKEDYPNANSLYMFQVWPKSCSMGINGSDNRLREVQRNLPKLFSNLSIMSTCGVKPPGGCHFPAAGYAEFARLLAPLIQSEQYGEKFYRDIRPPNLQKATFSADRRELILRFDQHMAWQNALVSQFHLEGEPNQVESGAVYEGDIVLRLKSPSKATRVTYLDSKAWSPDNLLYGKDGIAALTFCEVPIANAVKKD